MLLVLNLAWPLHTFENKSNCWVQGAGSVCLKREDDFTYKCNLQKSTSSYFNLQIFLLVLGT